MNARRRTIKALGMFGAAALVPGLVVPGRAQTIFPNRPVRIFTPFPGGSGPDAALRILSEQLARKWNKPVLIENKPGGNGFIAINGFRQAALDGHDLLQLDSSHVTTHPHTFSKLPYDVERDFTPLSMMLRTSFFVVVGARSRFRTIDDLIDAARVNPGRVTYGSWFVGSPGHLGALRLESMKGLQMTHVPFRDFGQLYGAVASGDVDWALGSIASAGGFEKAGKLRFIALAAPTRDPQYPSVPCTAELASVRGYEVSAWAGLFAPRAIPVGTRDRLASDIADALGAPDVMTRYASIGFESPRMSPDAFGDLIRRETLAWRANIQEAHLRLD